MPRPPKGASARASVLGPEGKRPQPQMEVAKAVDEVTGGTVSLGAGTQARVVGAHRPRARGLQVAKNRGTRSMGRPARQSGLMGGLRGWVEDLGCASRTWE